MSFKMSGFPCGVREAMWMFPFKLYVCCLSILACVTSVSAQWTNVGVGIDYQYFRVGGTNDIFVARMSRTIAATTIDTMIGQGKISGALETVRNQAARYDDALTWWGGEWGARNHVVVAINGGFYNTSTYVITGGQIQSGWYAHYFADAFSGFAWQMNRTPFIGECVTHTAAKVYVRFQSNGSTQPIDGINQPPGASDLILFTPQYNNQTPSGARTEVLVEMVRPNLTTSGSGYSSGIIRSKAQNTGSTWIPFDHIVFSAAGSEGTTLNANASVGSEVRIFQELTDKNEPDVQGNSACQTATGVNWANTFASINSNFHFLKNSVVRVPDAVAHPGYIGYVNLNPRTAICYNADYVFFVVVDGRSAQSVGIGCADLGYWAKAVLGATDGVNIDGGGSSTMVVNGVVRNVPSDQDANHVPGVERAVCNGVMMVNLAPKAVSTVFKNGETVTASVAANIRLGPGTNYGIYSTVSGGVQGTVVEHALNGIYAKGHFWWKCNFGGTIGWIAESLLVVPFSSPAIIQQPSSQNVVAGGTASFSLVATGGNPMSYRWQKNNTDLNDGGHYLGSATSTLMVSNCDSNDIAVYRCVVTNDYGGRTSSVAALTIVVGCAPGVLQNANFEGGSPAGVATGWTTYEVNTPSIKVWSIQTASSPEGVQYQQIQVYNDAYTANAGVRQDITGCVVGGTYQISGWYRSNSDNGRARVRVSPSASTSWNTATNLNPVADYGSGATWATFSGTVVATSSTMTLWLDGRTIAGTTAKVGCFDAITVTCLDAPVPPGILQQPSDQSVATGENASFTVLASGSNPLSYRWQKNNTNLNNGGHYSGANTLTLNISNTDTNDRASYRCVITNVFGSTNSTTAVLTVAPPDPCAGAGAPKLAAQWNGNVLTLTWPECPVTRLEQTATLMPSASWTSITNGITTNAGQKSLVLSPTNSGSYFRLILE